MSVKDADGNVDTGYTTAVTLTLRGTGGGTLGPASALTVTPVNGVAAFSSLYIDGAGTYNLTASAGALTSAASGNILVKKSLAYLAFTRTPASETAGTPFATQPQVTAYGTDGQVYSAFTGTVGLALSGGDAAAKLKGTSTATAVAGRATFAGLSIDKAGKKYVLSATATSPDGAKLTAAAELDVFIDNAAAASARMTEQSQSKKVSIKLSLDSSITDVSSMDAIKKAIANDLCTSAGIPEQECASRVSVTSIEKP